MKEQISTMLPGYILLLVLAAVCSPLAAREVTATIRGVVVDPSGAGIPKAEVNAV